MSCLKGFKVTDNERKRLFGVACRSFEELVDKGSKKLQVEKDGLCAYLQDGTMIDEEYFQTLQPQTVVILTKGDVRTGADLIYDVLRTVNVDLLKAGEEVEHFFQDGIKDKIKVLSKLAEGDGEEDFAEWSKGVETGCRTKEAYMEMRCRERIRGYFYSAVKLLRLSDVYTAKKLLVERLTDDLKAKLDKNKCEGHYFNRAAAVAMCDAKGVFTCGGLWDRECCNHNGGEGHKINPYKSREQRIIFSTWNLDHRIEKSRTIIPTIISALSNLKSGLSIDSSYIYTLLFTKENLKIVHIVCHDKSAHITAKIDTNRIIVRSGTKVSKLTSKRRWTLEPVGEGLKGGGQRTFHWETANKLDS